MVRGSNVEKGFMARGTILEAALVGVIRLFIVLIVAIACAAAQVSKTAGRSWGNLETEAIILEPPSEYLSNARVALEKFDWFMTESSRTNLFAQLKSFDLTAAQRASLLDLKRWSNSTNGHWFSPGREMILGLSRLARGQLYLLLGKHPENVYQHYPFILQQSDVDTCLVNSGLASETIILLKQLLYKRGPCWCFSDMAVFGGLPEHEFKRLLKTLSRVPAVVMRLRVNPESDVSALIGYWGKHGREGRVRTLLESVAKVPGGAAIDITHLLPPLARERLYQFPDRSDPDGAAEQHCFWTALNFFNQPPNNRFAQTRVIQETLEKDYVRTRDQPAFGDLIALADGSGTITHVSVYIADDVVFTKNGGYILKPWVLMRIADMVGVYATSGPLQVVTLRLKQGPARSGIEPRVALPTGPRPF